VDGSVAAVIERVREQVKAREIDIRTAAGEIGVTEDSLSRHLEGAYVRSDSAAKYRVWLDGGVKPESQLDLLPDTKADDLSRRSPLENLQLAEIAPPRTPWRVIDLFSGCGGLSLGFELLNQRAVFRTVLAIDVEDAMVDTFNVNHSSLGRPVGRKVDLSDFINETEVRAFYLDHLRSVEEDPLLDAALEEVSPIALSVFKGLIHRTDHGFLNRFEAFRSSEEFESAYREIDSRVLGQTSVRGFHEALRIPLPSTRDVGLGPMIWVEPPTSEVLSQPDVPSTFRRRWDDLGAQVREQLAVRWDDEVSALEKRSQGSGRGQLVSSSRRIRRFLSFLDRVPSLRELWLDWRSRRDSLRFLVFGDEAAEIQFDDLYTEERSVSVLTGGPPCQGFSRIGRGKIRSLREDRVHVHYDSEAGDLRNRLFEKYVLFVSALAPDVFLFENVRHFQTEVQTPQGTYLATEILAEAVRELSGEGLNYELSSRTIMASDHSVPQRRDRFFMAGVRRDLVSQVESPDVPEWILTLPVRPEVPLRFALHDLPDPYYVGGPGAGAALERTIAPIDGDEGTASASAVRYTRWIKQLASSPADDVPGVDAHVARNHRRDDREWFALMGPGKRWMDYRCDDTETLKLLQAAVGALRSVLTSDPDLEEEIPISRRDVENLSGRLTGDLTIRLLLETIRPLPGELGHHLAKATYLKKREGNHGDWLARLDANRPSKTVVTHMGKDTYAYVHPWEDRTVSVREAARIQTFPDSFSFGHLGLVDAFRVIGNAVPPLLSNQMADRVAQLLTLARQEEDDSFAREAAAG
jgi:site-specific DNA-cytosine methylase